VTAGLPGLPVLAAEGASCPRGAIVSAGVHMGAAGVGPIVNIYAHYTRRRQVAPGRVCCGHSPRRLKYTIQAWRHVYDGLCI
jgi:hypothetical protein